MLNPFERLSRLCYYYIQINKYCEKFDLLMHTEKVDSWYYVTVTKPNGWTWVLCELFILAENPPERARKGRRRTKGTSLTQRASVVSLLNLHRKHL